MATAIHTIGKLAVVLAVTVLLLGGLAIPAGAAPRSQGVSKANDFVLTCTADREATPSWSWTPLAII